MVKFKEILETERYDAEYFQPRFMFIENRIKAICHTLLGANSAFVPGPFGSEFIVDNYDKTSSYRYVRGKDVKNFFLEENDNVFIPQSDFDRLNGYAIRENDLLISVVGTLGNSCIVTSNNIPAIFSCKSTIIRNPEVNPFYLLAYLNSDYGKSLLLRNARGTVQTGLNLPDLRKLIVPKFSKSFEQKIESVIKIARVTLLKSTEEFRRAEEVLLNVLALDTWQPPEPLTYTRRAAEVFAAGRLDAEHFQPKYDTLIETLKQNSHRGTYQLMPIKELSAPLKYGCSEQLEYIEEGRIFLRIADLKQKRFELESVLKVPSNTLFRESDLVQEGDVLISRSGTLGIAVPITKEFDNAVYGSYFIRTRPDRAIVHPEYLSLFVNSFAGQFQVEGKNTGGVQTNLTIPAIESILVPVGSIEWQMKFVTQIYESIACRLEAKSLLIQSKRAVEIAIEQSESAALAFLHEQESGG